MPHKHSWVRGDLAICDLTEHGRWNGKQTAVVIEQVTMLQVKVYAPLLGRVEWVDRKFLHPIPVTVSAEADAPDGLEPEISENTK